MYELVVANALWGQKGTAVRPEFGRLLKDSYGAELSEADFSKPQAAADAINGWVAKNTRDKVKDILSPDALNARTRLVLANAVYFNSKRREKFPKDATKDGKFMADGRDGVTVPLMHLQGDFDYAATDDFQMLALPYMRDELSMLIILPKKVDGIAAVEKALTADDMTRWLKDRKSTLANVTLPKFRFTSQFRLSNSLAEMGMPDAFDPAKADLSGMTGEKGLYVSEVFHKAFVSVDEEGTEAVAASVIPAEGEDMAFSPPKPVEFKADHPFVFLIRHSTTGAILFAGRVANPKGE
ncbi:MAG: serpin family protein [Phycisphaerae bacterium]